MSTQPLCVGPCQRHQLDALRAEIERLRALIKRIDATAPLADSTCREPGITISEAVSRMLRDEGHPSFLTPPASP